MDDLTGLVMTAQYGIPVSIVHAVELMRAVRRHAHIRYRIAIGIERLPVKDRSIYERMLPDGTLLYLNPDGAVATESIAWDQDWLAQHGLVRTKVDLVQVIDHSFVDYALGRLGHYAVR